MGLRYRIHEKILPGTPDVYLKKYNAVIFYNDCFWHGHHCSKGTIPESNKNYWKKKIEHNVEKKKNNIQKLLGMD